MIRRLFSRLSRGVALGLLPSLLVIGASGAHPVAADTTPLILIQNQNLNCVVEVTNGPVMGSCSDTNAVWKQVSIPNMPNDFLLRSNANGNCLDIVNHQTTEGAQVDQRACHFDGSDKFQDWHEENGLETGFHQLANEGDRTDIIMHPSGCSAAQGILLFMNERDSCNADDWTLV